MTMKPERRRSIAILGLVVVIAGGLAYAFRPEPVLVDVAAAEKGPLLVTVDEEGRTRVKEVFVVSAPIAGRLRRIDIHAGDPVIAEKTVLAVLEPATPPFLDARARAQAEAALKAAEAARDLAAAELDKAKAELAFAEAEMRRVSSLATLEATSRRALDVAATSLRASQAALATAQAALRLREHEVETARAQLMDPAQVAAGGYCCVSVRSPVSGTLLRVLQESEAVVAAGAPLLEIGDPAGLEVVAELLTTEAVRLAAGTEAIIEGWGGPPLPGRVHRVEPFGFAKISALGVEERRVLVVVDFTGPPQQYATLGHGFRVDLRFVVDRAEDVVKVPVGALFRQGDGWAVFVAADGTARRRQVSLGRMNDREAEVIGGLQAGTQVVVHPSDRVDDGVAVTPRPRRGAAG